MNRKQIQALLACALVILLVILAVIYLKNRPTRIDKPQLAPAASPSESAAEPEPWTETDYLKGLSKNDPSAIFPRSVMTKQSLEDQAENPRVQALVAMYEKKKDRAIDLSNLYLDTVPSGVTGIAWYRGHAGLVGLFKRLPSGSHVWRDRASGEIVLIAGCGNFFETIQSRAATSKKIHRHKAKPCPPRVHKHKPCAPKRIAERPPVCEDHLIAPSIAPPVRRWHPVYIPDVSLPRVTRKQATAHDSSSSSGFVYGRWHPATPKDETCGPGSPPPQPPTNW